MLEALLKKILNVINMLRRRLFGIKIPPPIISYSISGPVATITLDSVNNYAIRYTIDGTDPTYSSGNLYTQPFTISGEGSYNIKAIAYDLNNNYSTISIQNISLQKDCTYAITAPVARSGLVYNGNAQVLLSGGSTNVNGHFEYSSQTNAGTYNATWRFIPDDPTCYCERNGTVSATIIKANQNAPTATGATSTYPNAATATATGGGGHGSLEWSNGNSRTTKGSQTTKARWSGDNNYNASDWSNQVTLTVNEGTISFTAPTKKTGLTYTGSPQTLYNEGSSNNGTFSYTNGTATNAGTYTVTWIFTPTDPNYSTQSGSFEVEIGKANPAYTAPTKRTGLIYNRGAQALLNAGSTNDGTIQYSSNNINWSTTIPTATNANPTTGYSVYWRLVGDNNHNDIPSTEISGIQIAKVTPVLSVNPVKTNDWTYNGNTYPLAAGGAMKHSTTDSTTVFGTFTYNDATDVGTYTAIWSFTPTDTTNYNSVGPVSIGQVVVSPANSGIVAPTAKTGLSYNGSPQILYNPGTNTIPGSFTYTNGTRTNAGTQTVTWTFTPTDSNYEPQSGSFNVTIDKVDPTYVAPTAKTGLSYTGNAQTLYNPGTNTTPGSFSYTGGTGTNAGDYTVIWTFTPTDTTNYNTPPSGSLNTTIAKAPINPSVTMANWVYGGTASNPSVSGNSGNGNVAYYYKVSTAADSTYTPTKPSNAGTYTIKAVIPETANYNGATVTNDFTIAKANISPTVNMSGWTYGGTAQNPNVTGNTGNGAVTYSYKVSTAADNTYTPTKPSNVGTYTVRAQIAETSNYNSATVTNTFTIAKANPTITQAPTNANPTYNGSAQSLLTGGTANVPGTFTYGTGTNAGSYNSATWTFTPNDTANYNTISGTVPATIAKANITPTVSMQGWVVGQQASDPSVSGNTGNGSVTYYYKASEANDSTYTPTKPSAVGTYVVKAEIAATTNYNSGTATTTFAITQAEPNCTYSFTAPTAKTNLVYNGSSQVLLNQGTSSVQGTWSLPSQTNAGTYTNVQWTFTPNDSGYCTKSGTIPSVTIAKANQTVSFTNWVDSLPDDDTIQTSITQTPASGGGTVTYSTNNDKVATIDANGLVTAFLVQNGAPTTCTITVTKAATSNYEAATDTRQITVYRDYFTLIPRNSGTSTIIFSPGTNTSLSYSTNYGSTWTTFSGSVSAQQGTKVLFKGINYNITNDGLGRFELTDAFDVQGNIMSIVDGDDYYAWDEPETLDYAFYYLFYDCNIVNARKLKLSAQILGSFCYSYMFNNCTSLVSAPASLPATTLSKGCYLSMFKGCSSLTQTPTISATTLAYRCCDSMFSDCTSLVTAPTLSATTLAESCYHCMFMDCTSLTTVSNLPATTMQEMCYYMMFYGCSALVTPPSIAATTLAKYCFTSMFSGCTSLTTAPVLSAITLADYCYLSMFEGCSSLTYIKALFTTTPSTTYTQRWVFGVANSGTFVKNTSASWNVTGEDGIPSGWSVSTASS